MATDEPGVPGAASGSGVDEPGLPVGIGEKCLAILRGTHDGDDLSTHELRLVELAVNGRLSPIGHTALDELYRAVRDGRFVPFHERPKPGEASDAD